MGSQGFHGFESHSLLQIGVTMCYLCLKDFELELPLNPDLEQKKERLLKIKTLLNLAAWMQAFEADVCNNKLEEFKEEQYRLSREF